MTFVPDILAAMTSDEIFKNMGQSMDQPVNPNTIMLLVVGFLGLIILLAILQRHINNRPVEKGSSKPAGRLLLSRAGNNHPGKLTKELAKQIGLTSSELRQLKLLAEKHGIEHPMALLLCPSVLRKTAEKPR